LALADTLAQRYGVLPSAVLRIDDPLLGYWIDELAAYVGSHREAQARTHRGDVGAQTPPTHGALIKQVGREMVINGTVPIIERDDL
jgi:hypothetical protein